jgi:peptide/nickel transport system permease protein
LGAAGGVVILLMLLAAIFAEAVAPFDPKETNFLQQLQPPNAEHLLGTDAFGRDVLSRLIHGARTALLIGFFAAFVGSSLGTLLGVASANYGGKVDLLLERLMDIVISFPQLILALAVVGALGTGTANVIIAITVPIIPRAARVIRASALPLPGRRQPANHAATPAAECGGTLPDLADRVSRPGDPVRSFAELPRAGRVRAGAGLGVDA